MTSTMARQLSLLMLAFVAVAITLSGCRSTAAPLPAVTVTETFTVTPAPSGPTSSPTTPVGPSATPSPRLSSPVSGGAAQSGLATIAVSQLPAEAQQVLAMIDEGADFPYRQDGQTFRNDQKLLPAQSLGFYREYTVETPGSSDRGARRIVAGDDDSRFYTADHYRSFKEVLQ